MLTFDVAIAGRLAEDRIDRLRDRVEALDGRVSVDDRTGRRFARSWLAAVVALTRSLSARYRMTALTRLWTAGSHVSPSFMKIELMTFSTDRSVTTRSSAIDALFLPSAIFRSTSRSRAVSCSSGDVVARARSATRPFDHLRVDQRASERDRPDGAEELVEIVDVLLQDVGAPGAAGVQQRECVARVRVLAQDDDAEARVRLSQASGGLDPLVGVTRRHPDVGDHDVRGLAIDGLEQRVEVPADRGDLEPGLRVEQAPDAFTDEVMVFGEHDADRHGRRIRR